MVEIVVNASAQAQPALFRPSLFLPAESDSAADTAQQG
jgi:hypothetical protein